MKFKKYNSIENSYRQKFIDMITIDRELMEETWYVHEKIHGANFAMFVTKKPDNTIDVKFGKRSGFIKDDEKFYSYDLIKDTLLSYAVKVANAVNLPDTLITIRGELFGGGYNHPDVESTSHSQVQKGIQYSPKTEFMAFDLEFDDAIVDWEEAQYIFEIADVPVAPFLLKGPFEDCIAYQNEFESIVPEQLGLPKIDNNNICEGVVIKPNKARYFNNGNRVILKNKNDKFSEKTKVKKAEVVVFSDEMNEAVENISQFINENRLKNVLSHFGEIKQKDFGKINGLFSQDVILDYLKEYEPLEEKKDWKRVTKLASSDCALLLRKHWLDILDGEY